MTSAGRSWAKPVVRGIAAACVLLLLGSYPAARAAEDLSVRVELWNFYQWNEDGSGENKLTFRIYQDVGLGSGWSVTFREELALILTDKTGTQNPGGSWATGIGDGFVQAVVSTPEVLPDTTLQAGLRVVFPTGGESPFGNGSYQLGPIAGVSHSIESVAQGLLLNPYARYLISVAEVEESAKPVRKLQLYPHIALRLSERWQVALWADEPIVYDRSTDEWFVPFDGMVGYEFAPGATVKFGGSVNLTENTTQYRHMLYGSLSFKF